MPYLAELVLFNDIYQLQINVFFITLGCVIATLNSNKNKRNICLTYSGLMAFNLILYQFYIVGFTESLQWMLVDLLGIYLIHQIFYDKQYDILKFLFLASIVNHSLVQYEIWGWRLLHSMNPPYEHIWWHQNAYTITSIILNLIQVVILLWYMDKKILNNIFQFLKSLNKLRSEASYEHSFGSNNIQHNNDNITSCRIGSKLREH